MRINQIEDDIRLEFGILESAIVEEWHTKDFVYIETNHIIYKKKINDDAQNRKEKIAKINDAKNRSQLLNYVPII